MPDVRDVDLRVGVWEVVRALPFLLAIAVAGLVDTAVDLTVRRLFTTHVDVGDRWHTYARRWPWERWTHACGPTCDGKGGPAVRPWSFV